MLKLTLKEATCNGYDEQLLHGYVLYIIKDKQVVFYVGQSFDPINRLQEHLGSGERGAFPDRIGQLIFDNQPSSSKWTIELFTLEELLNKQDIPISERRLRLDVIERETIVSLRPCINYTGNKNATPLPKRYRKNAGISNEGVKLS